MLIALAYALTEVAAIERLVAISHEKVDAQRVAIATLAL